MMPKYLVPVFVAVVSFLRKPPLRVREEPAHPTSDPALASPLLSLREVCLTQ